MNIEDIDLDELVAKSKLASDSAWNYNVVHLPDISGDRWHAIGSIPHVITGLQRDEQSRMDAEYIEAARPEVVQELVAEIRRLRGRVLEGSDAEEKVLVSKRVCKRGSAEHALYRLLTKRWVLPVLLALSSGQALGQSQLLEKVPGAFASGQKKALDTLVKLGLAHRIYPTYGVKYGATYTITSRGLGVVEAVRGMFNWIDAQAESLMGEQDE